MPFYLYHLTLTELYKDPNQWTDEIHAIIDAHRNFLVELGKQGTLIFAGRTDLPFNHPDLFGIALINAESRKEAQEMLKDDPAVVSRIQKAAIFPFRLALKFFENYNPNG